MGNEEHDGQRGSSAVVSTRRDGRGLTRLAPIRRRVGSAYRAGPGLDEALDVCRRLAAHGLAATIGYTARRGEPARSAADAYLAAFDRLSSEDLDCYVSVKLSMIGFDPALFGELAAAAAQASRRLHLDALAPETADRSWELLEAAEEAGPVSGTLPGRWRRSPDDAARAAGLGVAVRIVKGQWQDAEAPGPDAGEGFLAVVDRLRDHAVGVGVATHDVPLLTESLRRLTATQVPCEAELFYGLPFRAPARVARELGVPIRVYVPYGDSSAPYQAGDLKGRPAATWWLAQDLLLGKNKTWRSIERSRVHR
jgi:proline dehydrogenase